MDNYYISYMELVGLNSDELKSILKSNSMGWNERRVLKTLIAHEIIKEFLPIIVITIIGSTIIELLGEKETSLLKDIRRDKNAYT